jgi:hypothetical protein
MAWVVIGCGGSDPDADGGASSDGSGGGFALTVTLEGAGGGVVTSQPMGIFCGADCDETFSAGTEVTLAVSPDMTSMFDGWTGACASQDICIVTMDGDRAVGATFEPRP